jgi:hypothetical protein
MAMKTDDLLTLSSHQCAKDRRAFEQRSAVIGSIIAAGLIVMAWTSAYPARPVQAAVHDSAASELSSLEKTLERSGRLSGLEVLW